MLQITEKEFGIVKNILSMHVPGANVYFFGSRVNGTPKPHSDLDLALDIGSELSLKIIALLASDFEESLLPFRIDIVDFTTVSLEFKEIILKGCVILKIS